MKNKNEWCVNVEVWNPFKYPNNGCSIGDVIFLIGIGDALIDNSKKLIYYHFSLLIFFAPAYIQFFLSRYSMCLNISKYYVGVFSFDRGCTKPTDEPDGSLYLSSGCSLLGILSCDLPFHLK